LLLREVIGHHDKQMLKFRNAVSSITAAVNGLLSPTPGEALRYYWSARDWYSYYL